MRKTRPATLTSSLLARKGEAEPARLNDGSVPKDVIALQEELVARVAADISREKAGEAAPPAEMPAAAADEPILLPPPEVSAEAAGQTPEIDDAEALGSAPIELPPGSADEPDYDPAGDAAAQQESQVTLADWTARAQSGDTPFAYERMSDAEEPEHSGFIPLALGATVVAVLATLAIWQFSDSGPGFMQAAAPPSSIAPAPAEPAAEAPVSESTIAAAPPPVTAPAPEVFETPPAPVAGPAVKPEAPPAASSPYVVQLVSTLSQETAESAWDKIAAKVGASGVTQPHSIERADLGAKGVRYRVQLTGFASYAAGQKACRSLKAQKLSCLVMRQ